MRYLPKRVGGGVNHGRAMRAGAGVNEVQVGLRSERSRPMTRSYGWGVFISGLSVEG